MIYKNYQQTLSKLLPAIDLGEYSSLLVYGLSDDTRTLQPGDIFLAYEGQNTDGHRFIDEAIAQGAIAVIKDVATIDRMESIESVVKTGENNQTQKIPIIAMPSLKNYRVKIIKEFYQNPQDHLDLYAITGTNGKTSCCIILAYLFSALQGKAAAIGTLGVQVIETTIEEECKITSLASGSHNTTPGLLETYKYLALIRDQGIIHVAIEATSIGLDQKRLQGLSFKSAIFTNLSHDHLDYHADYDSYEKAKYRLFEEYSVARAILSIDDPVGKKWYDKLEKKIPCITYSIDNSEADIYYSQMIYSLNGMAAILHSNINSPVEAVHIKTKLLGAFNGANILACAALLLSNGYTLKQIIHHFAQLQPVPGRLEPVANKKNIHIFIDYAHTPDALEQVLKSLSQFKQEKTKIWCVFGCGGDRDQAKRPMMGDIAARLSDQLVVTSDNPRTESPEDIIMQICQGAKGGKNLSIYRQSNRKLAIAHALTHADEGDIVLIAGKGHEAYQEINGVRYSFSDKAVVRQIMEGTDDQTSERT